MRPSELFAVIGFVCSLLAFNLWRVLPEDWFVYDKMLSIAIVFWLWSIEKYAVATRRPFKSVAITFVWLAVVNALDEFFGNPMDVTAWELILGFGAVIMGYLDYKGIKLKNTIIGVWLRKFL
jgi:hypothetical protein